MTVNAHLLQARNISVTFGSGSAAHKAVDDFSLMLESGEALGLIGESGCGKSTMLRVLAGMNPNFTGELLLDGQPVPPRRDKRMLRRMQMVFQDPYRSLHPRKIVESVLLEALSIHGFDDRQRRVDAVLESVGLGRGFRTRYPHELSGGQRQRVAIARALVVEPEVLLLDEPTSALDVSVQAEILNLLKTLRREKHLTFLMVSHDLPVVAHLCERIIVMNRGKQVEELSNDDARGKRATQPYTRELFDAIDFDGGDHARARHPHEGESP